MQGATHDLPGETIQAWPGGDRRRDIAACAPRTAPDALRLPKPAHACPRSNFKGRPTALCHHFSANCKRPRPPEVTLTASSPHAHHTLALEALPMAVFPRRAMHTHSLWGSLFLSP